MSELLSTALIVIQIIIGLVPIIGFLWGGFVYIIRPIRNLIIQTKNNGEQLSKVVNLLNQKVVPFMDSLTHEFSPNSGKSIKDQLNRIDDSIRLGELRSKMISNSLVSTGAYECNVDGNCTWVNNALSEIYGLDKDQMLGQGWLSAVKFNERQTVWETWHNSILNDIPYESEYTVVNQKKRNEFRVRTVAVAHKNLDGDVLGYYGTVLSI
jgi:PAS domain S-box-containing protein